MGEGFDTYENVVKRVVIAVGAKQSGHREVLACQLAEKLDHAFWTDFLGGLVARGVRSVGLAIAARSDGLDAALSDVLPGTPLQRSRTEFLNEVIALVPAPDRARAQRSLKGMFATSGQAAAQAQLLAVANGLEEVSSAAAEALRGSAGELFSYLAFPRRHWSHIGTLNGFKELNDRIGGRLYADDKAALSNAKVDCIAMNDSWKSEGAYVAPGRLHPTT